MADQHQVVTNFVIYSGAAIVLQCGFQVFALQGSNAFLSADGATFLFEHSYDESVCFVDVYRMKDQVEEYSCSLEIPINRTKFKWKTRKLGSSHLLYYRSAFEGISDREPKRRGSRSKGPELAQNPDDA